MVECESECFHKAVYTGNGVIAMLRVKCSNFVYAKYIFQGSSVVLFRNEEIRKYQMFTCPTESGGWFASQGMAGTRPGMLVSYIAFLTYIVCIFSIVN